MEESIHRLKDIDGEITLLIRSRSLLDWDQETYMPEKAIDERARQIALLERLIHERITSPETGELLAKLGVDEEHAPGPGVYTDIDAAFLRETSRRYDKAVRLPDSLVSEIALQASLAQARWAVARRESDFSLFAPHLSTLLTLIREKADCLGFRKDRYEPLLDEYEPWLKPEVLDEILEKLKPRLGALLNRITATGKTKTNNFLSREFPVEKQKAFGRFILEKMGFEFERGRLDTSAHPFTTALGSSDIRLTTRYNPRHFSTGCFGIIHECGHGLYDLGFSESLSGTLLENGTSLGIHESQSRLWENIVGRSLPFWQAFYPKLNELFPDVLADVDTDAFYRGINAVEPSLIRVEADEVTYNLHIILRYELERKLINEELAVEDLPDAWNRESRKLLGVSPGNDSEGVLQDIHWSFGAFGYFPTYTLGNLYSSQFYMTMKKETANLEEEVKKGNLIIIREWLKNRIHQHGRVHPAHELCRIVTGSPLDHEHFLTYLNEKYGALYGC
ncbi:MAG: carboxypeptidase M32 [Spirochaetales bacterium]|nr:carboxypeptidase M32 [Spirochaetales bacterium]